MDRPLYNYVIEAGTVHEATECAWVNKEPCLASASSVGVVLRGDPRQPT